LIGSFGATILGPIVTILVQLINVPVMLRFWGPQLYGEWLILSAIPTYLLLTDMGFGNVAGSDMTIRVNAGDHEGAIETFQSTMILVALATVAIATLLTGLFFVVPVHRALHLSAMSPHEARSTLILLSINCLVMLQWSVILAAYRSTGRYALGMLYVNCTRILEGASFFVILFSHARPTTLAAVMLCVSLLGTLLLIMQHRRKFPWLPYGFRLARRARIRELSTSAFAFMAFPTCAAISTQGMTVITGLLLGPIAVAVFNPMRTLTRTALQLTDAMKNSIWPELSAAYGRKDMELARRLHRSAFQLSTLMALFALSMLAIAGPRVFHLWTHGRLAFDAGAFYLLLLVVLANSGWNASSAVPMSANRHQRISVYYLVFSVASIGIAYVLLPRLGLRGAALGMLFADVGMSLVVVPTSLRMLSDSFPAFARSFFDFTQIGMLLRRFKLRRS
jgi:O-antigen/teichoic acid export membrane protein